MATIHQPAFDTLALFDGLLLLAQGRVMYDGPVTSLDNYLISLGHGTPRHLNPADQAIQLVNTEFYSGPTSAQEHLDELASRWLQEAPQYSSSSQLARGEIGWMDDRKKSGMAHGVSEGVRKTLILSQRNAFNYSRNLLAYGIRRESHFGLAA